MGRARRAIRYKRFSATTQCSSSTNESVSDPDTQTTAATPSTAATPDKPDTPSDTISNAAIIKVESVRPEIGLFDDPIMPTRLPDTVAKVSKKWFRVRDTYGVQLAEDQDVALILAITVCVDAMSRG